MIDNRPAIPVTADDVADYDFDAAATPPPGATVASRRSFVQHAGPDPEDPGHLATGEEWAAIIARAEGRQP